MLRAVYPDKCWTGGTSEHRAARIGDSNDPATFTFPELSSVKRCVPAIQGKFFTSPDAEGATLMSKGREIHCYGTHNGRDGLAKTWGARSDCLWLAKEGKGGSWAYEN
jgi:hypothetical protein